MKDSRAMLAPLPEGHCHPRPICQLLPDRAFVNLSHVSTPVQQTCGNRAPDSPSVPAAFAQENIEKARFYAEKAQSPCLDIAGVDGGGRSLSVQFCWCAEIDRRI